MTNEVIPGMAPLLSEIEYPLYERDGRKLFDWHSAKGELSGKVCCEILDGELGIVRWRKANWDGNKITLEAAAGEPFYVDPRYIKNQIK